MTHSDPGSGPADGGSERRRDHRIAHEIEVELRSMFQTVKVHSQNVSRDGARMPHRGQPLSPRR